MNTKGYSDSIDQMLKDYKPVEQGKVVAERGAGGWLVMLPDGSVEFLKSKRAIERRARKYFEDNLPPTVYWDRHN